MKSGWAAVVLLRGGTRAVQMAESRRIELSDPANPDSRQPYHVGFATARTAGAELTDLVESVRQFGRRSVDGVIEACQQDGDSLAGVGVVVGSTTDPSRIANDHIRIHALEGQLFRAVVEDTVLARGLPCTIWRERDLYANAATTLGRPEFEVRQAVAALGKNIDGPWRAEQKMAAAAAWLTCASRHPK